MATITTLNAIDNVGDSRAVINTNFANLNTDKLEATDKTGADTGIVSGTAGTSGNIAQWNADGDLVDGSKAASALVISDPTGVTGADAVTNVMSLTQAEYDAITPNASTLYVITA